MKNIPRLSNWVGVGYIFLLILLLVIYALVALFTPIIFIHVYSSIVFTIVVTLTVALIAITIYGFYKTSYIVANGSLRSWSPFITINVRLSDIKKVERTRIPFYFRGWGASLYSGMFFMPGLGWSKVIMTNLTDGVLITDKSGKHYLITPSEPEKFIKLLK